MEIVSYATLDFAEAYFGNIYGNGWDNIDPKDQQKLLNNATLNINSLRFKGQKVDASQPNQLPRKFCDGTTSDDNIVSAACCEEAYAIFDNGGGNPNYDAGFKSIKVGDTSIEDLNATGKPEYSQLVSQKAIDLLRPYLKSGTFEVIL